MKTEKIIEILEKFSVRVPKLKKARVITNSKFEMIAKEISESLTHSEQLSENVVFSSVRGFNTQKSTRTRQCFECMQNINKGEMYVNHQFRYDKTIMSAYFHKSCYSTHAPQDKWKELEGAGLDDKLKDWEQKPQASEGMSVDEYERLVKDHDETVKHTPTTEQSEYDIELNLTEDVAMIKIGNEWKQFNLSSEQSVTDEKNNCDTLFHSESLSDEECLKEGKRRFKGKKRPLWKAKIFANGAKYGRDYSTHAHDHIVDANKKVEQVPTDEEIDKIALKWREDNDYMDEHEHSFSDGAKWLRDNFQSQINGKWVSIEDELPPVYEHVALRNHEKYISSEYIHNYDLTTQRFQKNYTHWILVSDLLYSPSQPIKEQVPTDDKIEAYALQHILVGDNERAFVNIRFWQEGAKWLRDNFPSQIAEEKLKEIREELLFGVEKEDLLYIKMQINKIDTLLTKKQ